MSSLRIGLLLVGACVVFGCAGVAPLGAQSKPATESNDEYDGWLFKSLTKRGETAQATPTTGASPTATTSVAPGPLVAGPASPSASKVGAPNGPTVILASAQTDEAGPPPTIPPELPAAPGGAVSIGSVKPEEEKKGFDLSDLAPENVYKNVKKATGYGPNENIARAAMKEGEALFDAKNYKDASAKFATAADRWPDTPLEERALFLKAECEFFSDQYPKAHDTLGGLLKKYSNTRFLDTVVKREFAMGQYWERLQNAKPIWTVAPNVTDGARPMFDTFGYAIQAYERVRLNDPTGPLADDAVMATANAYFRAGRFEEAAFNYDVLMKEYASSEHQANAHVLCLQAKMRVYQGAMYIGAPLDDAKKIADQTLSQYGDKLGAEREKVAQARAQVVEEKANREFLLGEYYEKHSEYGAARMYYKSVIEQYPTTIRAQQARERLETIRNEPDKPQSWLSKLLPADK